MIQKHSIKLYGHTTSVSLEPIFWEGLKEIAQEKGMSIQKVIEEMDQEMHENLSSALRSYVCAYYKGKASK